MTNEERIALERVQQEINAPTKREHVGKPLLKWIAKTGLVLTVVITAFGYLASDPHDAIKDGAMALENVLNEELE